MAQSYPSIRYRRDGSTITLNSAEEEETLSEEYKDSPAEFGVETHPGKSPDPKIAAVAAKLAAEDKAAEAKAAKPAKPTKAE